YTLTGQDSCEVIVNASNVCGADTLNYLLFNNSVSIKDRTAATLIDLFPNPAHDRIKLKVNALISKKGQVVIFDILGKVIYQTEITNSQPLDIDVSQWNLGVYSMHFELDGKIGTKSFSVYR